MPPLSFVEHVFALVRRDPVPEDAHDVREVPHHGDHVGELLLVSQPLRSAIFEQPGKENVGEPQCCGNHHAVVVIRRVDLVGAAPVQASLPRRDIGLPDAVGEEPLHQDLFGAGRERLVR